MLITPAYAQAASGGNALFELLFPLIMVFAIIYFMICDRNKSVNVSMRPWSMPSRAAIR